jgi:hypothetical protein
MASSQLHAFHAGQVPIHDYEIEATDVKAQIRFNAIVNNFHKMILATEPAFNSASELHVIFNYEYLCQYFPARLL